MLLENKVALITGAGSGFGRATALLFAKEGAKVAAVDIDRQAADETVAQIEEAGGQALAIQADVGDEAAVKAMVEETVEAYQTIDILFNNAGIYVPGNVEETPLDAFQKSLTINVTAAFLAAKYAMPYLKENKGNIINTASAAGLIGFPDAIAYAASKGAVVSMTQAIAVDYASVGVRCNAICPGTGKTGMTNELLEDPDIAQGFLAPIPMQRFGEAEDVAKAALFLASDLGSYTTGHALPVDGGWTMS
ncbi:MULTISPECIES: SDR family NAD(P)-dependent oxidoreductase [Aerococcus]|uniref:SDR family oxidoreductase n=1 Tax=Aerococcus sanguinicola TaxID=119206 RepID=A0A5N1GUB6_9LACT|nr:MULTISPECIES: SDR family NAD(P)-dependent oxidoreductase [Aerococcus]KAA9302180.1 SDR family oxidoreductase [Aerococcus sanguinicola]MDK6368390.1 SDR family NAD(P)-dependent oxidoreductase [Aerococcus sp. UMB9870]MDK6679472.1 SDR family NAD(P)-dependent oxidoreductase [Aerococcus sp. UMB8608]MDK6687239.1 SDR family NAD(P)-dependent oxidoreductase [Aerococcus sp. UMB8623]MDK6941063.1 SDR family NAD(P)-dependent oxidoreductase [Aerococcus sp. UMB8487]